MITPSILEILVLGPVEIRSTNGRIKIPRKIERAILYYLAVENRPVSRTVLIDLLWHDAEQIDPRRALRTALSRLRQRLPDSNLITTDLDQVALDTERCFIDQRKFQESYLSLRGILQALPNQNPLPVQIVNQIKEALVLWRGDRVIQGDDLSSYVEFERWRHNLYRTLTLQREFLMRRLAAHYQSSGQLELAMDLYVDLGGINYQDTTSHLAVIEILTKLGRHQEALEFCDALEGIFEREYGAPLPEEIIKHCQSAQFLAHSDDQQVRIDWGLLSTMDLPLVGRTNEIRHLRQAYFRGGVLIIQGNLGIGKSRLVQEFYELLSPKPLLILATARENESILPLAPLVNAFRRYLPDSIWHEIDSVWANQLTLLFPELIEMRADCSLSAVDKFPSARQHLFDAIHHLLSLVAKKYGRVLFFLDDAHWADHQTLQALSYLILHDFFDHNGQLIITTQSNLKNPYLDELVNQIQNNHQVQIINLPGLNPDELRNLMDQVLEKPPLTSFVEQLYRETDGNPLMVLEIIRHLLEKPMDIKELYSLDRLPVPDSIQGLIRRRINHLSEDSRHLLTCASVIGNEIILDLLREVSDLHQHQFFAALDALNQSDILQVNTGKPTREEFWFFTHEIMREVVLKETPLAYQQNLHQHIAYWLSRQSDSSDKAAVIANHFRAGGNVLNAFEWLIKAADHAWNLGAKEDVLRAYQQAEEILNCSPESLFRVEQFGQLYAQWSDFAYQSNQVDFLDEVGVKLQLLAKQKSDDQLMGLANLSLANACFLREDYDTGLVLIQKAVQELGKAHHPEMLMQALFYQASFQWWILDFDGVIESSERILRILNGVPSENPEKASFQFAVQRLIAFTHYARGEPESALEIAETAYHAYFDRLSSFDRLRGYHLLTSCHFMAGHIDQSAHYAQEALKIARSLENTVIETLSLINSCKVEILQGHLDEAYRHITRALKLAEKSNKIQDIVAVNTLLGDIYDILHNGNQAMQYFRIAQVRQGYIFQSYFGLENNIHLARILTRSGQLVEAREILATTLEVSKQKGVMQLHIQALMADGLIDIEEHQHTTAEQKFKLAIDFADQRGLEVEAIWGKFRMALLAFSQQRYQQAEKFLMDILEDPISHEMVLLNKYLLEFAIQLSEFITLPLKADETRLTYQNLVAHLDEHTQSPPLRQDFLNAKRLWQEKEFLS